ncbi:hypothetical protein DEU56DRAFT_758032 [Suillus clintonianus]|uniref:uncharacterized protein n=1 Tax=Suillus clintonianus TaxID=1904413 RepID=UPI001B88434C|nr:uncharacterized protein DEU56DRAFT_758032 [Suillus clintonianus]KAG2129746.1 hypothetical protein DEU56DRAFT_758032 [Suillus clintonianus]
MPVYAEIFEVSIGLQCASTELSIFSRKAGSPVKIAYPICRHIAVHVVTSGLQACMFLFASPPMIWVIPQLFVTTIQANVAFHSTLTKHDTQQNLNLHIFTSLLKVRTGLSILLCRGWYRHFNNGLLPHYLVMCSSCHTLRATVAALVYEFCIGHQVPCQQHITNYIRVHHTSLDLGESAGHEGMQNGHREVSATDTDILNKLAAGHGISRYEEIGLLEEYVSRLQSLDQDHPSNLDS